MSSQDPAVFKTRAAVNEKAGTRRMLAHFTITPGWDGWLDKVEEAIEKYKPDSWKGYTVGGDIPQGAYRARIMSWRCWATFEHGISQPTRAICSGEYSSIRLKDCSAVRPLLVDRSLPQQFALENGLLHLSDKTARGGTFGGRAASPPLRSKTLTTYRSTRF